MLKAQAAQPQSGSARGAVDLEANLNSLSVWWRSLHPCFPPPLLSSPAAGVQTSQAQEWGLAGARSRGRWPKLGIPLDSYSWLSPSIFLTAGFFQSLGYSGHVV